MRVSWVAAKRFAEGWVILVCNLACAGAAIAGDVTPPGLPQFLAVPLHAPEQLQEQIQGDLTFALGRWGNMTCVV
jgi:hypothetical protein